MCGSTPSPVVGHLGGFHCLAVVGNVLSCFMSNVIERHAFGAQENVSSTPTDHRPTLVASQLPSGQAPPPDGWDFLQCLGRRAVPAGATLLVLKCGQLINKTTTTKSPDTLGQTKLPASLLGQSPALNLREAASALSS